MRLDFQHKALFARPAVEACKDNDEYMNVWNRSYVQRSAESELLAKRNLLEGIAKWIQGQRRGRSKVKIYFCDERLSSVGEENSGLKPDNNFDKPTPKPGDHVVLPYYPPNDDENTAEVDVSFDGAFAVVAPEPIRAIID